MGAIRTRTRPPARVILKLRQTNYWRKAMSNGWTPARRKRQAELIKNWKPWAHSTGPRTAEGKAKTARNANKGGTRAMLRELSRTLRLAMTNQEESRLDIIETSELL